MNHQFRVLKRVRGKPGGRAAREGNKDVIGRSNHGMGGDSQPELSI